MSVRGGLLALLTMGPAYGFQLHGELAARTPARRAVNVGQVYATLDRLVRSGAVDAAGATTDGLPLYRLSPSGEAEATGWLGSTSAATGEEWAEMLDRVLIALTIPGVDARALIAAYTSHWEARLSPGEGSAPVAAPPAGSELGPHAELAAAAGLALAAAALEWLARAAAAPASVREFSTIRPRRGRRPAA